MQSQSELLIQNRSLNEINERLSARARMLYAENEQLKRRAALDEDFAKYIECRDEVTARKDEYIRTLEAENEKLKVERAELEKDVVTWRAQAEKTAKEYRMMEKKKEDLESKIADISCKYIDSVIGGAIEKDEYKTKYEALSKEYKKEVVDKVETNWMIDYAQKKPEKREGAIAIKDMLIEYYLEIRKEPQADALNKLCVINKIPKNYDANHPKLPFVGAAAQVVVSNNGEVKYYKGEDNGEE